MPTATLLGTTIFAANSTPALEPGARHYSLRLVVACVCHRSQRRVDPESSATVSSANGWGDSSTLGVPSIS